MSSIKCLCIDCQRKCSTNLRTELALRGRVTYLYLKDGSKITNNCSIYHTKNESRNVMHPVFI